jgi:hypothetical protein
MISKSYSFSSSITLCGALAPLVRANSAEAFVYAAMIRLMVRRLARA